MYDVDGFFIIRDFERGSVMLRLLSKSQIDIMERFGMQRESL